MEAEDFPPGSTWQDVHDRFSALAESDDPDIAWKANEVLATLNDMGLNPGPSMKLEEEVLQVFRVRLWEVLA